MLNPMPRQFPLVPCLLLAAISPLAAEPEVPQKPLQATLIETYQGWRTSMIEADYQAWQKYTANYRRAVTRNNIVSQKLKFPQALFAVPMKPPSIDGLDPIQARAVGPTGQLVYYGQIDIGLELPEGAVLPDNLLILKFIKDGSQWRFNTLSMLNLKGAAGIEKQIASKDYSFLNSGNFVPPGYVPLVPKECPVPAYVGQIQITSFGYDTEVTINGVSSHKVSDTATSELVIGGLKTSPNSVAITSRPIQPKDSDDPADADIPKKLEITVFAVPSKEGSPAHKSWHYEPKKVLPSYRGIFFAMPR
jgi:hypothetical protein